MVLNGDKDIQVTIFTTTGSGLPAAGDSHSGLVFNSGRNFNFDSFFLADNAIAFAIGTRVGNLASGCLAVRSCLLHHYDAFLEVDLSRSFAMRANGSLFSVFSAVSMTFFTSD